MKEILTAVGKILGLVFAAALIFFTGFMTYKLGNRMIPGDTLMQVMIIVLFDGAALVWFVLFITQAKGTMQWGFALLGWIVGIIGAVIMTAGELVLGQKLVVIEDPEKFGWILIATVVVAALVHVFLMYLFHFSDPATRNRIENAQKTSKAIETAYNNARQQIDNRTDELTEGLVASALHEAQQQINAVTAYHIRSASRLEAVAGEVLRGGPVVDATAKDAPPARPAQPRNVFGWMKRAKPAPSAPIQEINPVEYAAALGIDPAKIEELLALLKAQPENGASAPAMQVNAADTVAPTRISDDNYLAHPSKAAGDFLAGNQPTQAK
jgi:hypothetical protein